MDKLSQDAHWRQRMLIYCTTHGLTQTSLRYRVSRKCIWKWRRRWDGTWQSLMDHSRRPHHSPRQQNRSEEKLVKRYGRKHRDDLLLGYEKATIYGYTRSYGCFKRTVSRLLEKPTGKKRGPPNPKPYARADYPGQKIQLDVKYVPSSCVADGGKYYQFTAKDECSRWTCREMYDEHSTFSAYCFVQNLVRKAPFPIRLIQTDNGSEFTNTLLVTKSKHKTLFENTLIEMGIEYRRIRKRPHATMAKWNASIGRIS